MRRASPPLWAAPYIGLPFVEEGRTKSGCDCWGFLAILMREVMGIDIPLYKGVAWHKNDDLAARERLAAYMLSERERCWMPLEAKDARLGDMVLLKPRNGQMFHVGFVYAPGEMLHNDTGGSRAEFFDHGYWAAKTEGVYRWIS